MFKVGDKVCYITGPNIFMVEFEVIRCIHKAYDQCPIRSYRTSSVDFICYLSGGWDHMKDIKLFEKAPAVSHLPEWF